jgi:beta-glucosidase
VTLALTGTQDDLVRAVVAANPRTVVVVNAGAPVDLPWADDVPAVLWGWLGGMGMGEALARVLVGDDEPGGRLPFTVPKRLEDAPCDISAADPPGHLRYREGLLVGHRWYLTQGLEPRWWFGQGRGYAAHVWGHPAVPARWAPGTPLVVEVPVANTGDRPSAEVVQVYARRPASAVERPAWVLAGMAKARVAPDRTETVRIVVDPDALRHRDVEAGAWVVEPGPLELRVARSAGDPGIVAGVVVEPS